MPNAPKTADASAANSPANIDGSYTVTLPNVTVLLVEIPAAK